MLSSALLQNSFPSLVCGCACPEPRSSHSAEGSGCCLLFTPGFCPLEKEVDALGQA